MREKEALAVLAVLRARTVAARRDAIRNLRQYGTNLPFFGVELAQQQDDAEQAVEGKIVLPPGSLHDLNDPSKRNDRLARVEPGPDTVLPAEVAEVVAEWVAGWQRAKELSDAGVAPPGPLLLHGAPGTGKTATTRMIARQFDGERTVVTIEASAVVESFLGATVANIVKACADARRGGAVVVLEEVDTLSSVRLYESGAAVENTRATTAVMRLIEQPGPTILTSNRIDVLDPAVLRRCDFVVEMPMATEETKRSVVARELGVVVELVEKVLVPLTEALPMARRARRRAVVEHAAAPNIFLAMLNAHIRSENARG